MVAASEEVLFTCLDGFEVVSSLIFLRLFASVRIGDFRVITLSFSPSYSFDSCQLVEDIGIHVHVFAGSLDELCSPSTSALLADTFKLGTLHLVRGVGHISSMMECWQVWCLFFLISIPLPNLLKMLLLPCFSRRLLYSRLDPFCPLPSTAPALSV